MKREESIKEKINPTKSPKHVAIIMDGNGRWAKKRGMLRTFGHQSAMKAVRSTLESCDELNIPYLTLYAFSSENWNRPKEEINLLMGLLSRTLKKELPTLQRFNIRLKTIGCNEELPKKVRTQLNEVMKATESNTKTTLTLALSYGAKNEILNAVKTLAQEVKENKISTEDINESLFEQHLYTKETPNVDLLIRTSGECRLSNFLLWQIAYAELYFIPTLWPDFRKEHFFEAIFNYQNRERRFGKTTEQLNN